MMKLFLPVAILLVAGLTTISSVSPHLAVLQLMWAVIGAGFVTLFFFIDWRAFLTYRWFIWGFYGVSLVLLVVTILSAPVIRNTKSWIVIGPATFQPVELAKVALILIYAKYFSRRHLAVARWQNILGSFAFFIVPAGLVMLQPDLGSTLVLFGVWFGFLLVSGLPPRRIAVSVIAFVIVGIIGWSYALKPYQRERILGVFNPERNALTYNYSVIQSKIAIGSAGWLGKGYGQGSQTQLGFLSEPQNDFVLPAFIEEWGVLLGILLIGAYVVFVVSVLSIGMGAEHNFEKFICLGVAIVLGIHLLLNAGSAIGIFPVVGVPLPFVSYGGSNILISFFLLGIVDAIRRSA